MLNDHRGETRGVKKRIIFRRKGPDVTLRPSNSELVAAAAALRSILASIETYKDLRSSQVLLTPLDTKVPDEVIVEVDEWTVKKCTFFDWGGGYISHFDLCDDLVVDVGPRFDWEKYAFSNLKRDGGSSNFHLLSDIVLKDEMVKDWIKDGCRATWKKGIPRWLRLWIRAIVPSSDNDPVSPATSLVVQQAT